MTLPSTCAVRAVAGFGFRAQATVASLRALGQWPLDNASLDRLVATIGNQRPLQGQRRQDRQGQGQG